MLVRPMCLVHELPKNLRQKGRHRLGGCKGERVFQCARITTIKPFIHVVKEMQFVKSRYTEVRGIGNSLQHQCSRKSLRICVLLGDRKILCNRCKTQVRGLGLSVRR